MTPNSFTPCATFARETLAIPPVLYACKQRPPTKAAVNAAERYWSDYNWSKKSHSVAVGAYRIHVQMHRDFARDNDGLQTVPKFWVGLSEVGTVHGINGLVVGVPALPVDDLPARLHAAALGLLARYADTLTERAAALTAEATAVRALIPAPPARPVCPLCETDAAAPTVERLILVPRTVHAACFAACGDDYHEPGDAIDRLPNFIEEHMPDCDAGSLRYAAARADLAERHPGILTISSAIRAAR